MDCISSACSFSLPRLHPFFTALPCSGAFYSNLAEHCALVNLREVLSQIIEVNILMKFCLEQCEWSFWIQIQTNSFQPHWLKNSKDMMKSKSPRQLKLILSMFIQSIRVVLVLLKRYWWWDWEAWLWNPKYLPWMARMQPSGTYSCLQDYKKCSKRVWTMTLEFNIKYYQEKKTINDTEMHTLHILWTLFFPGSPLISYKS